MRKRQGHDAAREAAQGTRRLEGLRSDLRFAGRMLRKSPGFTLIAVLMLGLGIGASTAVWSVVDAVLLKDLPYPHAEQVVFPWRLAPSTLSLGYDKMTWGRVPFQMFTREARTFAAAGAFVADTFNLTGGGEPERLDGLRASAGFFPSLGVRPALGRTFTAAEDRPGQARKVVLSDALWRQRFAADPAIVGRSLDLNGVPYEVVGVMPRGFAFPVGNELPDSFGLPPHIQLWVPLALDPGPALPAESDELVVVGRLWPGVSVAQAQAEMGLVTQRLEAAMPRAKGWFNLQVTPLSGQIAADRRLPLLLLLAAVGVLLLIACSNVGGLILTRAIGRQRELALRMALGAGRARLLRQLLTESVVLALAGGAAGVLLAWGGVAAAKALAPPSIPRLGEAVLDARVLAFAILTTALTAMACGLAPALGAARQARAEALQSAGRRSTATAGARRLRNGLQVAQVALAFVLVVAAGLLGRTLGQLLRVDPGFRAAHVLTFELSLPDTRYHDPARLVAFYSAALGRLSALPGVAAAGMATAIPLGGAGEWTAIRIPGVTPPPGTATGSGRFLANYTVASPGYFAATGTSILRGRPFLPSDTAASLPVAVVSDAMARKFWPGEDPIGKQVGPGSPRYPLATIVGVAANVKRLSLRESPVPEMYVAYTQKVWPSLLTMNVVVRTAQAPEAAAAAARTAVHAVDPQVPVAHVSTLAALAAQRLDQPRFAVFLLTVFGGLALLLATLGMYGLTSFGVAQRTREIGIRMALGAQRRDVSAMVLRGGLGLAAAGVAIGFAAAWAVTRVMASFLFGVQATDPLTYGAVALLIGVTALAACNLPAQRAMRVDPLAALGEE